MASSSVGVATCHTHAQVLNIWRLFSRRNLSSTPTVCHVFLPFWVRKPRLVVGDGRGGAGGPGSGVRSGNV